MQCHLRCGWLVAGRQQGPASKQQKLVLAARRWNKRQSLQPATYKDFLQSYPQTTALASGKRNDISENDKLSWDPAGYDVLGPAFQATLEMLEWPKLCEQVSRFASTHAGKRACRALLVPEDPRETLRLLEQTRAITVLEYEWATSLDYGGIQTSEAEAGLSRAAKGGMLSAEQLKGIVSLVNGAERLRKQVVVATRENDALRPDSPVRVLLAAVGQLRQQPFLVRSVGLAIDEDANVMDSASEQLRGLRARVKALQGRLAALLKGCGGEVSDRAGRMCVAVPAGTKIPGGVLLGSSPGGGLQYIEPPAAVGPNNELGSARAEAQAAEEAVLWELTGLVMGALEELEATYRVVAWLDVLSARARYGMWIQGVLPEIVPWETVFHARGGAAMRRRARDEGGQEEQDADYGDGSLMRDPDERYAVRLRGLRHPLLYGEYLTEKESLERAIRMSPSPAGSAAAALGSSPSFGSRRRLLGTRKEVLLRRSGSGFGSGSDSDGEGGGSGDEATNTPQAALAALQPPRPIDWVVRPDTSVVVITGPNTGGKTAAMKALGLAACMAKAGLPLPAEAPARLPAFSTVLADIGDEQSLTANLSTFSGHLRRIQSCRAEADGKSLLLLDELGTGTDPLEGAALGVALLRKLVKGGVGCGALTVATTHHSVMTGLKFDDPRFENASVEFDEAALAPTYKLLWGVPGRSNALNIAARLGLDESVVAAARGRLDVGVATVNSAIEQLEGLRGQLEAEERATWDADREVKTLTRKLKSMHTAVEALHDHLTRARAEALLQVYSAARDRIRQIKEVRKRHGRAAPPPKPMLAQQAAPDTGDVAAAGGVDDGPVSYPSEEEIWEAWEATTRSRTAAAGVSAAAIGGPKASGTAAVAAVAAASGAPVAVAGTAALADPLRPLLDLSGDLADGALGLEALVDDLAAQERQAVMGQALKQQREEAEYDAALAAVDNILDVVAKNNAAQLQQEEGRQQQKQQRKAPRSGRARAAGRAAAAAAADSGDDGEDDAELAELMALLEEGEAALNARLQQQQQQQQPDSGPANSSNSSHSNGSGRSGQGQGQHGPARGTGGDASVSGQWDGASETAAAACDDLQEEFGDLDALLEEAVWALRAQQQQGPRLQGPLASPSERPQQQKQAQGGRQLQQPRAATNPDAAAPSLGAIRSGGNNGWPLPSSSSSVAVSETAAVADEAAESYLEDLLEVLQGKEERMGATAGVAAPAAAASLAGRDGNGDGSGGVGASDASETGSWSGRGPSSQQAVGTPGQTAAAAGAGGGGGQRRTESAATPGQKQQQQTQETQQQQRIRRGRRNW